MKSFVLVFVLIAVVAADDIQLTSEQRAKIIQYAENCIKETGASQNVVNNARNQNFIDDDELKAFMFCFLKQADFLNSRGEMNADVIMQKLPASADKAKVEKVLEECKTKTGKDVNDSAYEKLKCYVAGTNQRLVFN